jgi:hypothetical protein
MVLDGDLAVGEQLIFDVWPIPIKNRRRKHIEVFLFHLKDKL